MITVHEPSKAAVGLERDIAVVADHPAGGRGQAAEAGKVAGVEGGEEGVLRRRRSAERQLVKQSILNVQRTYSRKYGAASWSKRYRGAYAKGRWRVKKVDGGGR